MCLENRNSVESSTTNSDIGMVFLSLVQLSTQYLNIHHTYN